ncbi:Similar to hypothetical protein TRV_03271 [Trichophyton verrucosum HKI 0517]; acc. no. XP_003022614 [Pyronema omphalodes CBS 100304]|uniref:Prenylcysteine lyase domain-containing protein n=1 Tax=Pyronema omphalodes (strain CBS 100304) TaxID=1076935 RepID=U4LD24_PYROM|nr:Similar to hypothetical protein TRV_03271 [Trichophyton verrucosum HKI 0517]; acc. no. XP_003022614 [Pyronema omphalodes CBS 100304]
MIRRWLGNGKDIGTVWRGYEKVAHSLLLPNQGSTYSKIQLDQGLWYTGAMEEVATGIDMGAMMGENVAALIVEQWGKEGVYLSKDRRRPIDEEEERRREEERRWREEERKRKEEEKRTREEEEEQKRRDEERKREEERKRKNDEEWKKWWDGFWESVLKVRGAR